MYPCMPCAPLECVLSYLPVLWLLLMPLHGITWGVHQVVRQSFFLIAYIVLSSSLPSEMRQYLPCFNGLLLFGLMCLPYTFLPDSIVELYSHIMILGEALLLAIEAYQIIVFIRLTGMTFVDIIGESSAAGKCLVLFATGISYAIFGYIITMVLQSSSHFLFVTAVAIVLLNILIQVVTITKEEGIISDSALVSFVTSLILIAMKMEIESPYFSKTAPRTYYSAEEKSFLYMIFEIPHILTGHTGQYLRLLRQLFSPLIWCICLLRLVTCLTFFHHYLPQWLHYEEWESYDYAMEEEESENSYIKGLIGSALSPNASMKIASVVVYSQMVIKRLTTDGEHWSSYLMASWLPPDATIGRVLQCFGLGLIYLWSLVFDHKVW